MARVRITSLKVVTASGLTFFRGEEFTGADIGLTDEQTQALVDAGSAEWVEEESEEETDGGVTFASAPAADLAEAEDLEAADFEGVEPSGQTGYTKADVESVLAED